RLRRPHPIPRSRLIAHAAPAIRRRWPRSRALPRARYRRPGPRRDRESRQGTPPHSRDDELKLAFFHMRHRISDARRVVVKLGSNLFFNEAGAIALGRIFSFIEDIAAARVAGRQMIVVSSGAVALGADALKMKSTDSLAQKQALAAIGQSRLMNLY